MLIAVAGPNCIAVVCRYWQLYFNKLAASLNLLNRLSVNIHSPVCGYLCSNVCAAVSKNTWMDVSVLTRLEKQLLQGQDSPLGRSHSGHPDNKTADLLFGPRPND